VPALDALARAVGAEPLTPPPTGGSR
jgi:hypothetical protein